MIINIASIKLQPIHIGENTHHHDQSIVSVSLSTTKIIVSTEVKPNPPEVLFEFAIIILF